MVSKIWHLIRVLNGWGFYARWNNSCNNESTDPSNGELAEKIEDSEVTKLQKVHEFLGLTHERS